MEERFSYIFLSLALFAAALAAGVATSLEWAPCQGAMLNGLLDFSQPAEGFSDACLARMDGSAVLHDGSAAVPLGAGAVGARGLSALLLAVGWLGYASRLRLPVIMRAIVLLPVIPIVWFAVETWSSRDAASLWNPTIAMGAIEITAIIAAIAIFLRPGVDETRNITLIGLFAVAAYGLLHFMGEYALMIAASEANWDVPPGMGFPTAAMIGICGALVLYRGLRVSRAAAGAVPSSPTTGRAAFA